MLIKNLCQTMRASLPLGLLLAGLLIATNNQASFAAQGSIDYVTTSKGHSGFIADTRETESCEAASLKRSRCLPARDGELERCTDTGGAHEIRSRVPPGRTASACRRQTKWCSVVNHGGSAMSLPRYFRNRSLCRFSDSRREWGQDHDETTPDQRDGAWFRRPPSGIAQDAPARRSASDGEKA